MLGDSEKLNLLYFCQKDPTEVNSLKNMYSDYKDYKLEYNKVASNEKSL